MTNSVNPFKEPILPSVDPGSKPLDKSTIDKKIESQKGKILLEPSTIEKLDSKRVQTPSYKALSGHLWEAVGEKVDPKSGCKIFEFRLRDAYKGEDAESEMDSVISSIAPAVELTPSGIEEDFEPFKDDLEYFGFSYTGEGKLFLPSPEHVMHQWKLLQENGEAKGDDLLPDFLVAFAEQSEGEETELSDEEFIKQGLKVDAIVSRGREFVHDMLIHVASNLIKAKNYTEEYFSNKQELSEFLEKILPELDLLWKDDTEFNTILAEQGLNKDDISLSSRYAIKMIGASFDDVKAGLYDDIDNASLSSMKSNIQAFPRMSNWQELFQKLMAKEIGRDKLSDDELVKIRKNFVLIMNTKRTLVYLREGGNGLDFPKIEHLYNFFSLDPETDKSKLMDLYKACQKLYPDAGPPSWLT